MKCFPKINVFLKVVGFRGSYHELASRFVLLRGELFDELEFVERQGGGLLVEDKFEKNIVVKAYETLSEAGFSEALKQGFKERQVRLVKRIPSGGGLGGGSSDAAAFLVMCNAEFGLSLSLEELQKVGAKVGADVPFFVSGLNSANVSGIGEIIEPFFDDVPPLRLVLSSVFCETPKVFGEFRRAFLAGFSCVSSCVSESKNELLDGKFKSAFAASSALSEELFGLTTREILSLASGQNARFSNLLLNDLLSPCLTLYPNFNIEKDEFLSGSGSSKFALA